jgi:mono/diheme cytochrome c family protein
MARRALLILAAPVAVATACWVGFATDPPADAAERLPTKPTAADATKVAVTTPVDFGREVKPILAERCISCHGPDKAEGGLNLTERKTVVAELDSGATAAVPGKADASEILRRVTSDDHSERMPPEGKPLKPVEVAVLRRWINEGAEFQSHWAYRPLVRAEAPAVKQKGFERTPLDAYVLAKLEAKGIGPSPDADPNTLVKRLYFDLLGLLPKPEEVDAFLTAYAASPDHAYEALVDKLLASPHFGERWGRHWLDMARYADSDGYEKDRPRPDAYVFRDWVINALNDDMPFDRFSIEQIAGDLLPATTPNQQIATAFNRQTLTNEEGGVDQEEYRVNAVFDRTDTLGTVWLGLTVGCAKCHNHKYDEISQREYYQLFAFFNEADEVSKRVPVKATDLDKLQEKVGPLLAALEERRRELAPLQQKWEDEQRAEIELKPSTPLKVEPLTAIDVKSTGGAKLSADKDGLYRVSPAEGQKAAPATDTCVVTSEASVKALTGFRIDAFPNAELPNKAVSRSKDGNFVITNVRAEVVDAAGKVLREIKLQRPAGDTEQPSFKAADSVTGTGNKKKGWSPAGKIDEPHYLNLRTHGPLDFAAGERLRVTIDQLYGEAKTLARFRVRALTGDSKDLHLPAEIVTGLKMYPEKRVAALREKLFDFYASQDDHVQDLQKRIEATYAEFKSQLMPVRMISTALKKRKTHRFDRGDFLSPAEEVQTGLLHVLPNDQEAKKLSRLELARWLVGKDNPLTPRVVSNQIWARLFGAGLVRSVNDFGVRGDQPTHPELLDYLALKYRDDLKWSTKKFLKSILMSSTYRQASTHRPELVEIDPLNTLLARQNRLRVEGEVVRDLALGAAGLLSAKIGGPSVFPPMPGDLAKLSYANNFSWADSKGEDRYRRGMYTFFKRTIPHPTLMTFDCPDANVTCVNRTVSNTPLQALTLLNNESFVEASQSLAKRLLELEDLGDSKRSDPKFSDTARLDRAIRICLARPAEADEIDRLDNLLDKARQHYKNDPEGAEELVGRFAIPSIPNHETAAWIATVRVLLNLDEFITRE